jgi:glycosyltransferase involved in cell wall biosynthesis
MNRQGFTIIIPTRNRPASIAKAFLSIGSQMQKPDELIVVDSSDNTTTKSVCQSFFASVAKDGVRCVYARTCPGLAHQRNIGVSLATQDVLIFIDDDCILLPDYIQQMSRAFSTLPLDVVGVGGRFQDEFHYRIPRLKRALLPGGYKSGTLTLSGQHIEEMVDCNSGIRSVCRLSGANMAYRRWLFEYEMFDEYFAGYGLAEDLEFSIRASRHGRLVVQPKAVLIHEHVAVSREREYVVGRMEIENHTYIYLHDINNKTALSILDYVRYMSTFVLQNMYSFLVRRHAYVWGMRLLGNCAGFVTVISWLLYPRLCRRRIPCIDTLRSSRRGIHELQEAGMAQCVDKETHEQGHLV